ncbi:unnamed protein product [Oncorhynchus mykiss]|uniref:W2 domain-containing protein n=1 Tax=Oncorhynchus mykiss TaxID=8022 RepID=A0A060Y002_ONCMY|nr:unnamed protein product [Oncorhynchus mykiss]
MWNNVHVSSNVEIHQSVVCDGAVVKEAVRLNKQCVLAYNVVIGPNLSLPEGTVVSMHHPEEEEEDDDDEFLSDDQEVGHSKDKTRQKAFNPAEVGPEGKGYIWKASMNDTEDEELAQCLWGLVLNPDPESDSESEASEESQDRSRSVSPEIDDVNAFQLEVLGTLQRGLEENIVCDNLVLEINSLNYVPKQYKSLSFAFLILFLKKNKKNIFSSVPKNRFQPPASYFFLCIYLTCDVGR